MTNERIAFNPLNENLDVLNMSNLRVNRPGWLFECKGPNKACRAAHKAGRHVHIIAPSYSERDSGTLAFNTCHYASIDDAIAAYNDARANAPVVHTRSERDAAYACNETIWVAFDIDLNA